MQYWKRGILTLILCSILPAGSAAGHKDNDSDIKNAVRATLKDADSAQFKMPKIPVEVLRDHDLYYGCVNAKNSFGGYVGYMPFLAFIGKDGAWHAVVAQDDLTASVLHDQSAKNNYDLDC